MKDFLIALAIVVGAALLIGCSIYLIEAGINAKVAAQTKRDWVQIAPDLKCVEDRERGFLIYQREGSITAVPIRLDWPPKQKAKDEK